jgi:hypothetical protein
LYPPPLADGEVLSCTKFRNGSEKKVIKVPFNVKKGIQCKKKVFNVKWYNRGPIPNNFSYGPPSIF